MKACAGKQIVHCFGLYFLASSMEESRKVTDLEFRTHGDATESQPTSTMPYSSNANHQSKHRLCLWFEHGKPKLTDSAFAPGACAVTLLIMHYTLHNTTLVSNEI